MSLVHATCVRPLPDPPLLRDQRRVPRLHRRRNRKDAVDVGAEGGRGQGGRSLLLGQAESRNLQKLNMNSLRKVHLNLARGPQEVSFRCPTT